MEEVYAFGLLSTFPEGNQTVHEAELYAVVRALQLCTARTRLVLHVDNQAVQVTANKLMQEPSAFKMPGRHGRLWKMLRQVARREVEVRRVAAHQKEPPLDTVAWQNWHGNANADSFAKRALSHWKGTAREDNRMIWRLSGCRQLWALAAAIARESTLTGITDIRHEEEVDDVTVSRTARSLGPRLRESVREESG
eukprot:874753-Amphidinium_carterae.2